MIKVSYTVNAGVTGTVGGGNATTIEGYLVSFADAQHAWIAIPSGTTGDYKFSKVLVNLLTLPNFEADGPVLPIGGMGVAADLGNIHRAL